ncbi:hypothetical protein [Streptomyces albidoflavus]|uniref:hypothetical protein n=1 Tax=Streptomyces albidoflavus TaxID=1886 RepID=UPI00340F2BE6
MNDNKTPPAATSWTCVPRRRPGPRRCRHQARYDEGFPDALRGVGLDRVPA